MKKVGPVQIQPNIFIQTPLFQSGTPSRTSFPAQTFLLFIPTPSGEPVPGTQSIHPEPLLGSFMAAQDPSMTLSRGSNLPQQLRIVL